jgi:hypothetical protein
MLALHLRMQALGIQPRFLINLNAENIGIRYFCLCFGGFPHRKVRIIRLMKHQCADAGFGIHHHPFGELHANIFRFQKLPDPGLVLKVRARRITETVALAAVARSKPLSDGQFGWVGKPQSSRIRWCSHSAQAFADSIASACSPQHRAHRAVKHEDALREQLPQCLRRFVQIAHPLEGPNSFSDFLVNGGHPSRPSIGYALILRRFPQESNVLTVK